ncbi:MAG: hypothetical protein AAFN77_02930 [Planctomycetota bacterium]
MLNQDFKEMLQCLSAKKVEYLLVDGYAMAAHGFPRATKDIDFWVAATPENSSRVYAALVQFGAPVVQIEEGDFSEIGNVFQIGVPPRRIDITTIADGVDFDNCSQRAIQVSWEGITIPVISRLDLIAN